MNLKCIIIDDEPTARGGLAEDVKEIDQFKVVGTAANAFEALEQINNSQPDLIFLDIEMPGLSGLDFLKLIKVKPMVILTTAYSEYALVGYDFGVVDYLLKPISVDRLKIACAKALELFNYKNSKPGAETSESFYVKVNGKMEKIALADILYIEAANNYIFIHTAAKRYICYLTLKGIEAQLPKEKFIRVHKSFIVSRDHVQQVGKSGVKINDVAIPLSKNFRSEFQKGVVQNKALSRHG